MRWLESEHGIRVMRFTNDDVLRGLDAVVETIREALDTNKETP
jgi:very-short-patch-repair endonuclease